MLNRATLIKIYLDRAKVLNLHNTSPVKTHILTENFGSFFDGKLFSFILPH